jgi:hypothetical protein
MIGARYLRGSNDDIQKANATLLFNHLVIILHFIHFDFDTPWASSLYSWEEWGYWDLGLGVGREFYWAPTLFPQYRHNAHMSCFGRCHFFSDARKIQKKLPRVGSRALKIYFWPYLLLQVISSMGRPPK